MKTAASTDLLTFSLGGATFGLGILEIEEINRVMAMTPVPKAPPYVRGIVNLRGRIVTVIDLGQKIGCAPASLTTAARMLVVGAAGECLGLLVDRVGRVTAAPGGSLAPVPANLPERTGRYLRGVLPDERGLVGVLDLPEVLRVEKPGDSPRAAL